MSGMLYDYAPYIFAFLAGAGIVALARGQLIAQDPDDPALDERREP